MKQQRSFVLVASMIILAMPAVSQTFADGPWSGSIQCQVNVDLNDYSRHETQTWALTGKKLAPNGQMRIYEAAWTVTGQGQFLARSGQTTAVLTKWTMNVPAASAALSFFMTSNQLALRIQNWSQTRADNAISATQQQVQNGVVQPQTQPRPPGSVYEWNFGVINEGITSDTLSGTKSIQVANLGAGMQQYGVQNQTATCNWQFTKGATGTYAKSEPQKCAQAETSINKTFNSMEADVAQQFEALIQQTTDPMQAASLKSQEQSMINQLENLKKQNIQANSGNCQSGSAGTYTAQNPPGTGMAGSNSNQTGGNGQTGNGTTQNTQGNGPSNPSSNQNGNSDQVQNASGGSGNQVCSLSDVAGMYNTMSQSLEVEFAKLIQQAKNARSEPAALAAAGNEQARQQVALIDQIITKLQEDEQKSIQDVVKLKQNALQQIAKAKTDAERNAVCQNMGSAASNITTLINSDADALNSIVGTGPTTDRSGTTNPTDLSGFKDAQPTKQPQSGGTDPNSQRSPAPQLLKVEPASAQQNTTTMQVALTGQGTHWLQGTTKLDFGPGITVQGQPVFLSATEGYAVIAVAPNAAVGLRTVTVTSPFPGKTESVALPNSFTVTAASGPATGFSGTVPHPDKTAALTNPPPASSTGLPAGTVAHPDKTAALANQKKTASTPAAPTTSGNYLVTITGLKCAQATLDIPNDGLGDEVYAAAAVWSYNRLNGAANGMPQYHDTIVYGDVSRPIGREMAGSMGPTGGIRSGDIIPMGVSYTRNIDATDNKFPLKLFQGTLTDHVDALVISPSVWEYDGANNSYVTWQVRTKDSFTAVLFSQPQIQEQINTKTFGSFVMNGLGINLPVPGIFTQTQNRPIGVVAKDFGTAIFPTTVVVLTREIIEAALSNSSFNHEPATGVFISSPGNIVIGFADHGDANPLVNNTDLNDSKGIYYLVLQVERVGGASPSSSSNAGVMENLQKAAESQREMQNSVNALTQ